MAIDPRSIIGEILSRRPDLRKAYAPRLRDMGFPLPNVPPAGGLSYTGVMTGEQLGPLAKYAGRTPSAPPGPGLTPEDMAIPFNGTGGDPNSLRSMADRGDPSQASGFRSRLADARMMQGSAAPRPIAPGGIGSDVGAAGTNPTAQVSGQLPGNFMSPGNLPRPRPFESMLAARPEGPPGGFPAAAGPPPPLSMARPEGPPGGFPAATPFGGNMPMPRQTAALGSGERSPLPGLPRARSPEMGPPMPSVAQGTMPGRETMAPPSALATRFNDPAAFRSSGPPAPLAGMTGSPSPLAGLSPLASGAFSRPPSVAAPSPIQPNSSVATSGGYQPAPGFDQAMGSVPPSASQPPLSPQMAAATQGIPSPADALRALPPSPAASVGPPPPLSPAALTDRFNAAPSVPIDPRMAAAASLRAGRAPAATIDIPGNNLTAGPPAPIASLPRPRPTIDIDAAAPVPPAVPEVPEVPPAGTQPIASMPAANVQSVPLNQALALSSAAPPAAIVGREPAGTPRARGKGQAPAAAAPEAQKPVWTAPKIGMGAGAAIGAKVAGPAGAAVGAAAGWGLGRIVKALRNGKATVDENGNIVDEAGRILGRAANLPGNIGNSIGNMFGNRGSSVSGGGGGGWGGIGGWGGGSSYTGGGYGGNAGANINQGIGQRFGQR